MVPSSHCKHTTGRSYSSATFPLTKDLPVRVCPSIHVILTYLLHRVVDETQDEIGASGINNAQGQSPDSFTIQRFEKSIRGENIPLCWYESHGFEPVAQPPTPRPTQNSGDLFIHSHASRRQLWILDMGRTWRPVHVGHNHPILPGRQLHISGTGQPGWVTRKTLTTYRGRK